MALIDVLKGSFTSGELSPRLLARQDVDRYRNGASLLENWMVIPQGGVTRRPGTRYVATVKHPERVTLVMPFEPSTTDAYILEVGHLYFRFYKNGARIENPPGTPVEVVTPYQETQLRQIRTAQANDVLILVHPSHAPQRLSRLSDTVWNFSPVPFNPPPLYDAGDPGTVALTLSAVAGGITITAASPFWVPSDINRVLEAGVGRALITGYTSDTIVTALVLSPFASVTILANTWELEGSPWADITPSAQGPVGAGVLIDYGITQAAETELMTTAFSGWTDYSGDLVLLTGTHTGANGSTDILEDENNDFLAAGVVPTHVVTNTPAGSAAIIESVTPHACGITVLIGGVAQVFNNGDAYQIKETGMSRVRNGVLEVHGGTAGHGWREVAVTTTAGVAYSVTFTVSESAVALQVGNSAQLGNLLEERSYAPGEHTVQFTASGATSYVQIRNNQPYWAGVSAVSVKRFSIATRLTSNLGKYLAVHDGLIWVLSINGLQHYGIILKELSSTDRAAAGAWELVSPAWSNTLGWPSAVVLYERRLYLAGSARFPQTVWGSADDDLFNFTTGHLATDALDLSLVDSGGNISLNRIRWLMPSENMLVGTTHGEYRLIGAGDDPLSPTSLPRHRIQSTFGSDTVQPLKVGAALLFAQRQGSKLREMSFDERTQTTYVARDITITSDHLLRQSRILELAYSQEPLGILWAVRSDGTLLGLTYDQSEQIAAWWRVVGQGRFESVATIPHPTANAHQVWVVAQHLIGATLTRFLERMDPEAVMPLRTPVETVNELTQEAETVAGWSGLTLDAAYTYDGAATNVFSVPHLIGATVAVVADAALDGTQVVPGSGTVTLQKAGTASHVWIGLPFSSRGRCLPVEVAIRGNTGQTVKKRFVRLTVRVEHTAGLLLQGEPVFTRQPSHPMDQGVIPFSGDRAVTPLGWSGMGMIDFVVNDPLPATIIGIVGLVDQAVER